MEETGEAMRFYALVGRRWGFADEEALLAAQLRRASSPELWLNERDALAHMETARAYLRAAREGLKRETVRDTMRSLANSGVHSCRWTLLTDEVRRRRVAGESEF